MSNVLLWLFAGATALFGVWLLALATGRPEGAPALLLLIFASPALFAVIWWLSRRASDRARSLVRASAVSLLLTPTLAVVPHGIAPAWTWMCLLIWLREPDGGLRGMALMSAVVPMSVTFMATLVSLRRSRDG